MTKLPTTGNQHRVRTRAREAPEPDRQAEHAQENPLKIPVYQPDLTIPEYAPEEATTVVETPTKPRFRWPRW